MKLPANWRGSLVLRLGWRLAAVMLAGMLLAAVAVAWRVIATVEELDDSALQDQVRLIAQHLPIRPDAPVVLPEAIVAPFRASDGDNVFMVYAGARLAATSDPAAATALAPLLRHPPRPGLFRIPAMAGHEHGLVGLVAPAGAWSVVVLQGREQTSVLLDSLIGNFLAGSVWLLLPLGVATIFVGVLTLRQGLQPLRQVSAAAALVGPGRPGARLPRQALPRELAPLVDAVNDALTRLEQALIAERRFMADAAHALRTPLAVLTARLDILGDEPEVAALRRDADRMGRLVGQMLRMARLDGLPLDVTEDVDLRGVAVEAISGLVPLALRRGVELGLRAHPGLPPVRGNQAALVLAVTNLIENALAHAPAASRVEVVVRAPATIVVRDRGPGVPPDQRARIFERFERGPTPHEGGAGLGLAIVAGIAAAHHGSVHVAGRAGGGAAFMLVIGQDGLAPGYHGGDEVLAVQQAGDEDAGEVAGDQPEQQAGGGAVQVADPRHAEEAVGFRQPAASGNDQQRG